MTRSWKGLAPITIKCSVEPEWKVDTDVLRCAACVLRSAAVCIIDDGGKARLERSALAATGPGSLLELFRELSPPGRPVGRQEDGPRRSPGRVEGDQDGTAVGPRAPRTPYCAAWRRAR